jgi:hypothetical protein
MVGQQDSAVAPLARETPEDWDETTEMTAWGPARRLRVPVLIDGTIMRWDRPAGPLGADPVPDDWSRATTGA